MAKDHAETNPITIKPKTASHMAEQFSWVPLPYCSPPGCPFPIKSLALLAHVSPWTIHFQVLDKSPVSGPRKGPPSCNSFILKNPARRCFTVQKNQLPAEQGSAWIYTRREAGNGCRLHAGGALRFCFGGLYSNHQKPFWAENVSVLLTLFRSAHQFEGSVVVYFLEKKELRQKQSLTG